MADWLSTWLAPAMLCAAASLCAVLMRWAWGRNPGEAATPQTGWPVLGGVLAGLLLGPTILGRLMPVQYEYWLIGGATERQVFDSLVRRQVADALVAQHEALDADQVRDMAQVHARERVEPEHNLVAARWQHQFPLRVFASIIVGLTLLCAGCFSIGNRDKRQGLIAPLSIGLWSAAMPGALAYASATYWWNCPALQAAMIAAAVAIGPWVLSAFDREAADQAEHGGARMIQTAGRIASIIALLAATWALWSQGEMEGLMYALPLMALPLGWCVAPIIRKWGRSPIFCRFAEFVLIPTLTTCVAIKIDVIEHFSIWPIVLLMLLSDDGRWIGAFLGAMLPGGRTALRTLRLTLGSMSAGPTQLCLAALAAHAWIIQERFVFALLLGAVLIEITAPTRRAMAVRLQAGEQRLGDAEDS